MENPIMTITMTDGGKIVCELYPEKAPQSVRNMISLANKGFYDGLIFHRVISGFMIQGGCPKGTGTGGPGYCIKGEFKLNGVKNNLSHKRGVLSMARAQAANSAGSQFFIMHEDGEFLDGQYAAFGKVLEGMDVVDKIAAVKTNGNDRPLTEQKIASIRVDTKGEEYPEHDKLRGPYGRGCPRPSKPVHPPGLARSSRASLCGNSRRSRNSGLSPVAWANLKSWPSSSRTSNLSAWA